MYILDTNTLIYFFKGMGRVAENLTLKSPQEIAIPAVVLYELEYGIAKSVSPSKRKYQLKEFCALVKVLPFQEAQAKAAARVRVTLEKRGIPIGPYDIMIAGTVLSHTNGVLVTRNEKEFRRIDKLKIENWY